MRCNSANKQLNGFMDGVLDAAQSIAIAEHIQVCPACRNEYEGLRAVKGILRQIPVPAGDSARERVLATYRLATTADRIHAGPPIWRRAGFSLGIAAAAAAAILLTLVVPLQPGIQPEMIEAPVASSQVVPTAAEIDHMTLLHSTESASVLNVGDELLQDAIADANSRIEITDDSEPM